MKNEDMFQINNLFKLRDEKRDIDQFKFTPLKKNNIYYSLIFDVIIIAVFFIIFYKLNLLTFFPVLAIVIAYFNAIIFKINFQNNLKNIDKDIKIREKKEIDCKANEIRYIFNQPYVSSYDNEKIYFLYELIEKYGLEKNLKNQSNNDIITFNIFNNIDETEYIPFENVKYDDFVKKTIRENVFPRKRLNQHEAEKFFVEYFSDYIIGSNKTFNDKEQILKKIMQKNNLKL